jgi:ubiquinone/menaquinone biosynthesis C-methylase UbiE
MSGESVLDVGCGTGSLAIAARRRLGTDGKVFGIDASPEMIARATSKVARAGISVSFRVAVAEALPFPDAQFDVVLSTRWFTTFRERSASNAPARSGAC